MIRYANEDDIELLSKCDVYISKEELENIIRLHRVIVMYNEEKFIGWLRFNLFWDNTPFMNMLYLLEDERGKGNGRKLVEFWESEMKKHGYNMVMTSSQSNEEGQFFYRKNNYKDIGSFILPNEPAEIIFYKELI